MLKVPDEGGRVDGAVVHDGVVALIVVDLRQRAGLVDGQAAAERESRVATLVAAEFEVGIARIADADRGHCRTCSCR